MTELETMRGDFAGPAASRLQQNGHNPLKARHEAILQHVRALQKWLVQKR